MKTLRFFGLSVVVAAAGVASVSARPGAAQEFGEAAVTRPAAETNDSESWYRSPTVKEEKITIAREKSMARGQARMARLDAMRWYGYSNSRPTAATMPFTTMYSPAWQMPGGRPFAWYTTARPVVVIDNSPTVVR
jgi:hypothetical protein